MYQIKLSILLLSFLLLTACGFKPVYSTENTAASPKLAAINIEEIASRDGQVFRNKLQDLLNPTNLLASPAYKLNVKLTRERRELGIQENLRVTRYDIRYTADYELVEIASNTVLLKDKAIIYSSFNRTESEFSTFVGEEDASEKAAAALAAEIKARLASYFD